MIFLILCRVNDSPNNMSAGRFGSPLSFESYDSNFCLFVLGWDRSDPAAHIIVSQN